MILNVTFDPVDGSSLGSAVFYTDLNLSINAVLSCTMENIEDIDNPGEFFCDPEAIAAGLTTDGCETCIAETQSCDACVFLNDITLTISTDEETVILTSGLPATITGNFTLDQFDKTRVNYVKRGSSTKIQTPYNSKPVDVPPQKDIFKIDLDSRQSKTLTIDATVTDSLGNVYSATYTYTVNNNNDYIKTWLKAYLEEE